MTLVNRYGILSLEIYWRGSCSCAEIKSDRSDLSMERIKTLETRDMCQSAKNGGCGECQTSCQSACKTSCGVANQSCENENK